MNLQLCENTPVFDEKHEFIGFLRVSIEERLRPSFVRVSHQHRPKVADGEVHGISTTIRVDFQWNIIACVNKNDEMYNCRVLVVRGIGEAYRDALTYVHGFNWMAEVFGECV